ncbi:MAG: hypothetical protein VX672_06300 [Planctomycetota bacterium]|nr:hypothetical protein [Planctomycetota bacterium]
MTGPSDDVAGVEIERKWLLHGLPKRLEGESHATWECWRLRQGYLPPPSETDLERFAEARPDRDDDARAEVPAVGRLRSVEPLFPSGGSVRHVHTLKLGSGMVRREIEREIAKETFDRAWDRTEGRRLEKLRWRVPEGGVIWEIDRFDAPAAARGMVLVEAEAADEAAAHALRVPSWIADLVEREVTHEAAFTNAEIAFRTRSSPA